MKCPECRGYGHPQDNQELDCATCEGQGEITRVRQPITPPWKVIVLDGDVCINPDRESGEYAIIAHVRKRPNADIIVEAVNAYANYNLLLDSMKLIVENLDHISDNPNNEALLNIEHLARAAMKKVNKCK